MAFSPSRSAVFSFSYLEFHSHPFLLISNSLYSSSDPTTEFLLNWNPVSSFSLSTLLPVIITSDSVTALKGGTNLQVTWTSRTISRFLVWLTQKPGIPSVNKPTSTAWGQQVHQLQPGTHHMRKNVIQHNVHHILLKMCKLVASHRACMHFQCGPFHLTNCLPSFDKMYFYTTALSFRSLKTSGSKTLATFASEPLKNKKPNIQKFEGIR